MESITQDKLQKYEDIIDQINREHKKSEDLEKELENRNDKIILYNLTRRRINQKLSYTGVKIFSDILSLFSLYEQEIQMDLSELSRCHNCKFHLIEVYIAKSLYQKLKSINCTLNVSLQTGEKCINKSLKISSRLPLLEIIPVDKNVVECVVETFLIFPNDNWLVVKLDTVFVDVSYHFQTSKKILENARTNEISLIAKRYDEQLDLKKFEEELSLEYELRCEVDPGVFMEAVLKNSYHNLGVEHFTALTDIDNNDFTIKLSDGFSRFVLKYNKNGIQIKTNASDLERLKKYFSSVLHKEIPTKCNSPDISELRENLPLSIRDARFFYSKIRKCWSSLQY